MISKHVVLKDESLGGFMPGRPPAREERLLTSAFFGAAPSRQAELAFANPIGVVLTAQ